MTMIIAGTAKGLFRLENSGSEWKISSFFEGQSVYAVGKTIDAIWAAPFTEWTGTALSYSEDRGETWQAAPVPLKFPESSEAALSKVWQIAEFGGKLFCGTEPAALFTSIDKGESWELCEGLWNHPHRKEWTPGFGGLGLHTILPLSEDVWVVGVSTGGVYRTEDGGKNWTACNQKIAAPFLPEPLPEFGQCVHKIAVSPNNKSRLILQHHWGVYRSDDAGKTWSNIGKDKLPSDFGFACSMNRDDSAFVIPIQSDHYRVFPEGKMGVFRTDDGGETFVNASNGLPQKNVYDCVLRDSLDSEDELVAFGTTAGSVFFSADNGDNWSEITAKLPRISCIRVFGD